MKKYGLIFLMILCVTLAGCRDTHPDAGTEGTNVEQENVPVVKPDVPEVTILL